MASSSCRRTHRRCRKAGTALGHGPGHRISCPGKLSELHEHQVPVFLGEIPEEQLEGPSKAWIEPKTSHYTQGWFSSEAGAVGEPEAQRQSCTQGHQWL